MSGGRGSGSRGRWLVIGLVGGAAILAALATLVRKPVPSRGVPTTSTQPDR